MNWTNLFLFFIPATEYIYKYNASVINILCIGGHEALLTNLAIAAVLFQYKVRGDPADFSSLLSDFREIWRCLLKSEVYSKLVLRGRHAISNDEWVFPCGHELLKKCSIKFKSFENTAAQRGARKKLKVILYILGWCYSIPAYGKNLKTFLSYIVPRTAIW